MIPVPHGQGKANILIIGGGGIGAITALNLTIGGTATVTLVLRSNYDIVQKRGYRIDSVDHGRLEGWRPHHGTASCSGTNAARSQKCALLTDRDSQCCRPYPTYLQELLKPSTTLFARRRRFKKLSHRPRNLFDLPSRLDERRLCLYRMG